MQLNKIAQLVQIKPKTPKKKTTGVEKVAKLKAIKGGNAPMPAMSAMRIGGKARI